MAPTRGKRDYDYRYYYETDKTVPKQASLTPAVPVPAAQPTMPPTSTNGSHARTGLTKR